MVLATDSPLLLCLESLPAHALVCFYNQKMEIFRCLHDPAGWVQGRWSYHGNLILNKLSVYLFDLFCFVFILTVKIILKTIVAIGYLTCQGSLLVYEQILILIVIWNLTYNLNG